MAMGARAMLSNDAVTKGKQERRDENDPRLSRKAKVTLNFPPTLLVFAS